MKRRDRRWHDVRHVNSSRLPYGDLMGDDDDLEGFMRTRDKMFRAHRDLCAFAGKAKYMGKTDFDEFMSHLGDIDLDRPLREYL